MQMLKEFLTRNWLTKLFSAALATLLWVAVSGQANSEIGVSIPLEYRNIPSQMEVVGDATNVVEVRLRGSSTQIREISARDVSATLDLSSVGVGGKIFQLTYQNVKVPFGLEVVRVSPSQIRLNLEHTVSKIVPVVVQIEGEPARNFKIDGLSVTPATVEVEGPESKMRAIQSMPTAPVDVDQRETSFAGQVDLDLPDPMLRLHYLSPVDVRINIRPRH
jgi:YbbR domain-containing protein